MASRHNDPFDDFEDEDDGYLTFDAREEQEGGNRTWLIVAGTVLLILVVGIVGWNLFAGGGGSTNDEAPVVASTDGEFKTAPDGTADSTGALAPGEGAGVLEGTDAVPPLSVEPLTGAEDPLLDGASAGTPGAGPPVPPAAAPKAAAPKAPPPTAARPASPPPAATRPATQVAQASPPAARPASPPPPPAVAARPAASTPASQPAAAPASPPAAQASGGQATGGPAAQLGSFRSRAQAETALASMREQGLNGANVGVVEADLGDRGTWYRIRATGFSSRSSAEQFCIQARSRGVDCIVASR